MATVSIPLSSRKYPGLFALIDEEDLPLVSAHRWHPKVGVRCTYATANIKDADGKYHTTTLHQFLMGDGSRQIDHRDNDGLNNARDNLRWATQSQNMQNARRNRESTNPYRGVSFHPQTGRWRAILVHNKVRKNLGLFTTPELAAETYDHWAIHLNGQFARTNFPRERYELAMPPSLIRLRNNNTSGSLGISWDKKARRWRAYATIEGRQTTIGWYEDKDEAILRRSQWMQERGLQ